MVYFNDSKLFFSFPMKQIDPDNISKSNERISCLIEELNSPLDLYYEITIESEGHCKQQ